MRSSVQNRCNGCGQIVKKFHVDHIHPKSRGGTNDRENLQILCSFCNLSKGPLTMREWIALEGTRGNLFWAGREEDAPKGVTSDPSQRKLVFPTDLARLCWDRDVDPARPSSVVDNCYLLELMTAPDARERIESVNLYGACRIWGPDGRKEVESIMSMIDWNVWPPKDYRILASVGRSKYALVGPYFSGNSAET